MEIIYLASFLRILFDLMSFAIIARVLLSWVQMSHHNRMVFFLHDITDPILNLAKKITPKVGMLDFSPLVALIGLDLLKAVLFALLGLS